MISIIKELSLIDKAKDLAQQVHLGQTRKVSKQPYIIHPFRVFQQSLLKNYNKDIQLVSLLHDTYEDSKNKKYVEDTIKSRFGNIIWSYVKLLSHDPSINYNEYVLYLAKKSKVALTVKLLDMVENLKDNPSSKQKTKYLEAVLYLLNNGINIDSSIVSNIKLLTT